MADVRAHVGVPVAAQFGGLETPTMCAPLVVDSATGFIYSLKTGDVVVAAAAAGTVTSVAASGGTTGLSFTGSPITTSGTLTLTGTLAVANGGTGITAFGTGVATAIGVNVGSAGAFVTFNGALGTPSSGTLTNSTGLPAAGVVGTALVAAAIGTTVQAYDADLTTWAGISPGTGVGTALAINVGSAGAFVTFNGAGGTPSSMTATNLSGTAASLTAGTASAVAVGGITGLGSNVATFLATASSANLAAALTDEVGSGKSVFGSSLASWSPTGNNVTLTVNGANYLTIGGMVFAFFSVTWPTTIDGNNAQIKDLPVTVSSTNNSGTIFGYTDYGAAFLGYIVAGGTKIDLLALTGVAISNVSVSGKTFVGVAVYPS